MVKIVIDPGHGGKDPGAIGPSGVQEKVITLAVAKKVATILHGAGIEVKLTRDTDKHLGDSLNTDLATRAKIANQAGADVFVSIHCNSASDRTAHGTETHSYPGSVKGKDLAKKIQSRLVPALGLTNRGTKESNFAVLRETKCPAVLVELAFISNPTEEALLESTTFQDKAARAIAEGIAYFLGVQLPIRKDPSAVRILVGESVIEGVLINDRTYAPVRALAEALGRTVEWNGTTKTVLIK